MSPWGHASGWRPPASGTDLIGATAATCPQAFQTLAGWANVALAADEQAWRGRGAWTRRGVHSDARWLGGRDRTLPYSEIFTLSH